MKKFYVIQALFVVFTSDWFHFPAHILYKSAGVRVQGHNITREAHAYFSLLLLILWVPPEFMFWTLNLHLYQFGSTHYLQVDSPVVRCFSLQEATVGSTEQATLDWTALVWCYWAQDWNGEGLEREGDAEEERRVDRV